MQNKPLPIFLALIFIATSFINPSANAEGVFKWKDAHGNIQYGDKPPKSSHARAFDMPALTVIENYSEQWKPLDYKPEPVVTNTSHAAVSALPQQSSIAIKPRYDLLKFIAPKANQTIHAKDGDVSAMISLKPPLKRGHKIAYFIDGKSAETGKSRITNFKNMSAGTHSVSVNIIDASGATVMTSNAVPFSIKR